MEVGYDEYIAGCRGSVASEDADDLLRGGGYGYAAIIDGRGNLALAYGSGRRIVGEEEYVYGRTIVVFIAFVLSVWRIRSLRLQGKLFRPEVQYDAFFRGDVLIAECILPALLDAGEREERRETQQYNI